MGKKDSPIGNIIQTALPGVYTASSKLFSDERGKFMRLFDRGVLADAHGGRPIVQVNQSVTKSVGAIRGMHFQHGPHLEAKWIRCIRGRVFDVAVDLRRGSPTFLRHISIELSEDEANMLFIPEGCAHGFQVLEPCSELLYLHTQSYEPSSESGVRWNDPALAIEWPLPVSDISQRDHLHPLLKVNFEGIPT